VADELLSCTIEEFLSHYAPFVPDEPCLRSLAVLALGDIRNAVFTSGSTPSPARYDFYVGALRKDELEQGFPPGLGSDFAGIFHAIRETLLEPCDCQEAPIMATYQTMYNGAWVGFSRLFSMAKNRPWVKFVSTSRSQELQASHAGHIDPGEGSEGKGKEAESLDQDPSHPYNLRKRKNDAMARNSPSLRRKIHRN
jgi:hypothetical protein